MAFNSSTLGYNRIPQCNYCCNNHSGNKKHYGFVYFLEWFVVLSILGNGVQNSNLKFCPHGH